MNDHKNLKGGKEKMAIIVTCKHCSYKWETNSDKIYVSCPNCLQKTPVNPSNKENEKK